jgi:hypothetical protein
MNEAYYPGKADCKHNMAALKIKHMENTFQEKRPFRQL